MNEEIKVLKVKGHPDLIRQKESSAILNTNIQALNKYREIREEKIKLMKVVEEQESIKTDLAEIKSLLKELLGNK
jgi:hypothetical protein